MTRGGAVGGRRESHTSASSACAASTRPRPGAEIPSSLQFQDAHAVYVFRDRTAWRVAQLVGAHAREAKLDPGELSGIAGVADDRLTARDAAAMSRFSVSVGCVGRRIHVSLVLRDRATRARHRQVLPVKSVGQRSARPPALCRATVLTPIASWRSSAARGETWWTCQSTAASRRFSRPDAALETSQRRPSRFTLRASRIPGASASGPGTIGQGFGRSSVKRQSAGGNPSGAPRSPRIDLRGPGSRGTRRHRRTRHRSHDRVAARQRVHGEDGTRGNHVAPIVNCHADESSIVHTDTAHT